MMFVSFSVDLISSEVDYDLRLHQMKMGRVKERMIGDFNFENPVGWNLIQVTTI